MKVATSRYESPSHDPLSRYLFINTLSPAIVIRLNSEFVYRIDHLEAWGTALWARLCRRLHHRLTAVISSDSRSDETRCSQRSSHCIRLCFTSPRLDLGPKYIENLKRLWFRPIASCDWSGDAGSNTSLTPMVWARSNEVYLTLTIAMLHQDWSL